MVEKTIILLVEDDRGIYTLIQHGLGHVNYQIHYANCLKTANDLLKKNQVDIILLDWKLPDGNGIELIKIIREHHLYSQLPILMITALSETKDIITALDMGADDYLTKPFSTEVLKSRINALLRRINNENLKEIIWKEINIDLSTNMVLLKNENVKLHRREFNLLKIFLSKPGKVYDRESLLNLAWGENSEISDRAVDVSIRRLRKAFAEFEYDLPITTIRGVGYRLEKD